MCSLITQVHAIDYAETDANEQPIAAFNYYSTILTTIVLYQLL